MTQNTAPKPHHHGDLRNSLIRAGIELLEEGGRAALTLRKCAAKVGVSHAAPAHHFNGLADLKQAIANEGFRIFQSYLLDARAKGPQDPHSQLKNICRGYLSFAIENPALFGLIFSYNRLSDLQRSLDDKGPFAYDVLRETCAPFVRIGADPVIVETQVWSLVHGYAQLYLSGRFGPVDPDAQNFGPFETVIALLDQLPLANGT